MTTKARSPITDTLYVSRLPKVPCIHGVVFMSIFYSAADLKWAHFNDVCGFSMQSGQRERLKCFSQPASLITYRRRQMSNLEDIKTV